MEIRDRTIFLDYLASTRTRRLLSLIPPTSTGRPSPA